MFEFEYFKEHQPDCTRAHENQTTEDKYKRQNLQRYNSL